jgi:hypothetical protein
MRLKTAADNAASPDRIEKAINRLAISADAKALTMNVSQLVVRIGEETIRVGGLIVSFAIDLAKRYPKTAFGVAIALVVTALIGIIPWIGPFLAAFLGPIFLIAGIAVGATNDLRDSAITKRLELLEKVGEADRSGVLDRLAILEGQLRASEATEVQESGAASDA